MSDSESFRSARLQSRTAIWTALIGVLGVIAAAWIGVGFGRSRSEDKLTAREHELDQRNTELTALRAELQTQRAALDQLRKELTAERRGDNQMAEQPSVTVTTAAQSDEKGGVRIDLAGCRLARARVTCTATMTQTTEGHNHVVGGSDGSYIWDAAG